MLVKYIQHNLIFSRRYAKKETESSDLFDPSPLELPLFLANTLTKNPFNNYNRKNAQFVLYIISGFCFILNLQICHVLFLMSTLLGFSWLPGLRDIHDRCYYSFTDGWFHLPWFASTSAFLMLCCLVSISCRPFFLNFLCYFIKYLNSNVFYNWYISPSRNLTTCQQATDTFHYPRLFLFANWQLLNFTIDGSFYLITGNWHTRHTWFFLIANRKLINFLIQLAIDTFSIHGSFYFPIVIWYSHHSAIFQLANWKLIHSPSKSLSTSQVATYTFHILQGPFPWQQLHGLLYFICCRIMLLEIYDTIQVVNSYSGGEELPFVLPFNVDLIFTMTSGVSALNVVSSVNSWLTSMPVGATANWQVGVMLQIVWTIQFHAYCKRKLLK